MQQGAALAAQVSAAAGMCFIAMQLKSPILPFANVDATTHAAVAASRRRAIGEQGGHGRFTYAISVPKRCASSCD
jgi:hypothetical protein